jgi:hypothetical protein
VGATTGAWGHAGEGAHGGVAMRGGYGGYGGAYRAAGAVAGAAATLKQYVLSDVVEQLRLEELNLAISDPLVRCVLALRGRETGDPQKSAERFLKLVYNDESNLKRLKPTFKELYKD